MKTSKSYLKYLDLGFEPDPEKYLLAKYHVQRAADSRLEELAFLGAIAAESSTGTWIDVTCAERAQTAVAGIVFNYSPEEKTCEIAYPVELFEPGNVSQLLTVVAGNAFGLADLSALRLMDIRLPLTMVNAYAGPALGLNGIYNLLEIEEERPIVGAIIKPKCGLAAKEHANICFEAWSGMSEHDGCDGVDMVKDDEALTSQSSFDSNFDLRIKLTLEACRRAEDITGRKKIYVPNITHSNMFESLRRAELVKDLGGDACMIDYVISGCALLHTVRSQDLGMIIHGHRTMFAALHRPANFGVDYRVWAKLFRVIGGDQVHAGTPAVGVMQAERSAVVEICRLLRQMKLPASENYSQDFGDCLPIAPICGAGLDPTTTEPLVGALGHRVIIFAGGGCHGHPDGTAAGASALKESALAVSSAQHFGDVARQSARPYLRNAYNFFSQFDKQSPNDGARENL